MKFAFGVTTLELSKEDILSEPHFPILRVYDDNDLIGIFSIETGEIVENIDLADYDIRFVEKQLNLNRDNYLETWNDYVSMLHK